MMISLPKNLFYYLSNIIYLAIGITSLIIGIVDKQSCEYETIKLFTINNFLITIGTGSIIFSCYYLVIAVLLQFEKITCIPKSILFTSTILHVLFILYWYAVGYNVIIYSKNMKCITVGSFHAIYTLTIWSVVFISVTINQTIFYYRLLQGKPEYLPL